MNISCRKPVYLPSCKLRKKMHGNKRWFKYGSSIVLIIDDWQARVSWEVRQFMINTVSLTGLDSLRGVASSFPQHRCRPRWSPTTGSNSCYRSMWLFLDWMSWGIPMDSSRTSLRDWGNCSMSLYWSATTTPHPPLSFITELKSIYLIVIDRLENVCLKNN